MSRTKACKEGKCNEDCEHVHYPPSPSPDVCCDEYPNCEHYVEYSSTSPVEPATDEERLYTVITIRVGEGPDMPTLDEFIISAWATSKQLRSLKEFFLESIMLDHLETDKKHKEAVE
jgi:hypothetical protein